jgi:hypothetical protein
LRPVRPRVRKRRGGAGPGPEGEDNEAGALWIVRGVTWEVDSKAARKGWTGTGGRGSTSGRAGSKSPSWHGGPWRRGRGTSGRRGGGGVPKGFEELADKAAIEGGDSPDPTPGGGLGREVRRGCGEAVIEVCLPQSAEKDLRETGRRVKVLCRKGMVPTEKRSRAKALGRENKQEGSSAPGQITGRGARTRWCSLALSLLRLFGHRVLLPKGCWSSGAVESGFLGRPGAWIRQAESRLGERLIAVDSQQGCNFGGLAQAVLSRPTDDKNVRFLAHAGRGRSAALRLTDRGCRRRLEAALPAALTDWHLSLSGRSSARPPVSIRSQSQ